MREENLSNIFIVMAICFFGWSFLNKQFFWYLIGLALFFFVVAYFFTDEEVQKRRIKKMEVQNDLPRT